MKSGRYDSYDFAPVLGAEVEINTSNGSVYNGTLVMADKLTIGIKTSGIGVFRRLAKEDILNLSATIKGREMSLNQMEICAIAQVVARAEKAGYKVCDAYCGSGSIFYNIKVVTLKVYFLDEERRYLKGHTSEYNCFFADINLDDIYPCTSWGWKATS